MRDGVENMKISIFVPFFPPKRFGGFEIASYNIADYLTKAGHVHRISRPMIRIIGSLLYFINIFWCLKKIDPDIIHLQAFGIETPAFFLIKKLLKKPCVIWGQGSDVYVQWMFKEPISKIVFKKADAVIALTEDMKGEMKKIYDRDIAVIPNGIDLSKVKCVSIQDVRNELGIKKDRKIILFAGALHPIKGLTYLIEAMTIIGDKNKQLILVGDGEERDQLEDLVKKLKLEKYVTFIGKVPYDEVFKYMVASDIFVLSSLSEGLPNVIIEAMASGLPIVATRVGGLPDIIKDGENGFLVDPKNPDQIAEKIKLFLEDDKLREKISKNNKKKVKEYSWESVIERLEKIYFKQC
jgi:glycosyltransferase involved in cell wall biosynthesis